MNRDYESAGAILDRLTDLYIDMIDLKQEIEELEARLNYAYQDEEQDEEQDAEI